jgi:hypothetical protein
MNLQMNGPQRPKLWPPKALLSSWPKEPTNPSLAPHELRRIVAGMIG